MSVPSPSAQPAAPPVASSAAQSVRHAPALPVVPSAAQLARPTLAQPVRQVTAQPVRQATVQPVRQATAQPVRQATVPSTVPSPVQSVAQPAAPSSIAQSVAFTLTVGAELAVVTGGAIGAYAIYRVPDLPPDPETQRDRLAREPETWLAGVPELVAPESMVNQDWQRARAQWQRDWRGWMAAGAGHGRDAWQAFLAAPAIAQVPQPETGSPQLRAQRHAPSAPPDSATDLDNSAMEMPPQRRPVDPAIAADLQALLTEPVTQWRSQLPAALGAIATAFPPRTDALGQPHLSPVALDASNQDDTSATAASASQTDWEWAAPGSFTQPVIAPPEALEAAPERAIAALPSQNVAQWQALGQTAAAWDQQVEYQAHRIVQRAYHLASRQDFAGALQWLDQVPAGTRAYAKAQTKIGEYLGKRDLRVALLRQRSATLAAQQNWAGAIAALEAIQGQVSERKGDRAAIAAQLTAYRQHLEAQAFAQLQAAYDQAAQLRFSAARQHLAQIPPQSQFHATAQRKSAEYRRLDEIRTAHLLGQAQTRAQRQDWAGAIAQLDQIPADSRTGAIARSLRQTYERQQQRTL